MTGAAGVKGVPAAVLERATPYGQAFQAAGPFWGVASRPATLSRSRQWLARYRGAERTG